MTGAGSALGGGEASGEEDEAGATAAAGEEKESEEKERETETGRHSITQVKVLHSSQCSVHALVMCLYSKVRIHAVLQQRGGRRK